MCVSDHKAITFKALLPPPAPTVSTYVSSRIFNTNSADNFHKTFTTAPDNSQKPNRCTDNLLNTFNNTREVILDSIAPTKIRKVKPTGSMLWLNNNTKEIKCKYRQAERKWKNDPLVVSY